MKNAIHLEPVEFIDFNEKNDLKISPRVYVLDNGIAGIVYTCYKDHTLYFLNQFIPSNQKLDEYKQLDFFKIHDQISLKINLDEATRN